MQVVLMDCGSLRRASRFTVAERRKVTHGKNQKPNHEPTFITI